MQPRNPRFVTALISASILFVSTPFIHDGSLARAAQTERPTAVREAEDGAPAPSKDSFTPGLGEIMTLTQMRHMKLWFAGEASNWPLAAYELDELEEGFADAIRFHPTREKTPRPLAELVSEFVAGPLAALRSIVDRRDADAFPAAFDALTQGCNACHAAAQFSFNVIVRPSENPYSDQRFSPPR